MGSGLFIQDNCITMKMLSSSWSVTYVSLFPGSLRVGPPGTLADLCLLSSPPTDSSLAPVKIHSTPDLPYSSTVVDRVAERQIFCKTLTRKYNTSSYRFLGNFPEYVFTEHKTCTVHAFYIVIYSTHNLGLQPIVSALGHYLVLKQDNR